MNGIAVGCQRHIEVAGSGNMQTVRSGSTSLITTSPSTRLKGWPTFWTMAPSHHVAARAVLIRRTSPAKTARAARQVRTRQFVSPPPRRLSAPDCFDPKFPLTSAVRAILAIPFLGSSDAVRSALRAADSHRSEEGVFILGSVASQAPHIPDRATSFEPPPALGAGYVAKANRGTWPGRSSLAFSMSGT